MVKRNSQNSFNVVNAVRLAMPYGVKVKIHTSHQGVAVGAIHVPGISGLGVVVKIEY